MRAEAEVIMADLAEKGSTQFVPVFTYLTIGKRERIKAAIKVLISESRLRTFTSGTAYTVLTDDDRAAMTAAAGRAVAAEAAIKQLQEMIGTDHVLTGDQVIMADYHDSLPYDPPFFEALADPVALLAWLEAKLKGAGK